MRYIYVKSFVIILLKTFSIIFAAENQANIRSLKEELTESNTFSTLLNNKYKRLQDEVAQLKASLANPVIPFSN